MIGQLWSPHISVHFSIYFVSFPVNTFYHLGSFDVFFLLLSLIFFVDEEWPSFHVVFFLLFINDFNHYSFGLNRELKSKIDSSAQSGCF